MVSWERGRLARAPRQKGGNISRKRFTYCWASSQRFQGNRSRGGARLYGRDNFSLAAARFGKVVGKLHPEPGVRR